jgi:outer membrane protein
LKQNIKHSLKKRRQLDAEIKRFKQAANFQSQAQTNGQAWAQQKRLNYKKRATLSAQQALSQQLQQESGTKWTH